MGALSPLPCVPGIPCKGFLREANSIPFGVDVGGLAPMGWLGSIIIYLPEKLACTSGVG